jgi:RNA polymerase sigma-70 factor (ECF subfamily)
MNTSPAKLKVLSSSSPVPSPAERARSRWLTASPRRVRDVTAALYAEHRGQIVSRLKGLGLSPEDADELCTEVFVVAMRKLPSFQGQSSLSTWLHGIARKLASDHRRSARNRHESVVDTMPESESLDSPELELDERRETIALHEQIAALKPTQRNVVKAFVLQEQPMDEVARKEGVPLQTAYARLYAAYASLEKALSTSLI